MARTRISSVSQRTASSCENKAKLIVHRALHPLSRHAPHLQRDYPQCLYEHPHLQSHGHPQAEQGYHQRVCTEFSTWIIPPNPASSYSPEHKHDNTMGLAALMSHQSVFQHSKHRVTTDPVFYSVWTKLSRRLHIPGKRSRTLKPKCLAMQMHLRFPGPSSAKKLSGNSMSGRKKASATTDLGLAWEVLPLCSLRTPFWAVCTLYPCRVRRKF